MRMYAVITPPPHVLADLEAAVERAAALAPEVPWLARDLWHLRLAYFGNLDLKQSTTIRETLQQIGSYSPPLGLRIAGIEALPGEERAESLGFGLAGDLDDLWSLAKAIPSMVQRHGLFLDRRSFRADVTVAHGSRGPFDARAATSALADYRGVPWTAHEMQLVRWLPGSGGAADGWQQVEAYGFTAAREEPAKDSAGTDS
jgi:RNA 2',3'-cyclic 3'-phosphodiesterase